MWIFDDWLDFIRVAVILISIYSFVLLIYRFKRNRHSWNAKTRDYWYAFLMWTLAGGTALTQGIILDRPLTPGFIFIIAAVLVTGKGLYQKGSWGERAD